MKVSSKDIPVTAELVREVFSYDPDIGVLVWIAPFAQQIKSGAIAGHIRKDGYVAVKLGGKAYKAHRLIWLYMTGRWPADEMDHIDRNPTNNRWDNLREATHAENCRNRIYRNLTTFTCVGEEKNGKYRARVRLGGERKYLGLFDTPEAASAAVRQAKLNLHGEFSV